MIYIFLLYALLALVKATTFKCMPQIYPTIIGGDTTDFEVEQASLFENGYFDPIGQSLLVAGTQKIYNADGTTVQSSKRIIGVVYNGAFTWSKEVLHVDKFQAVTQSDSRYFFVFNLTSAQSAAISSSNFDSGLSELGYPVIAIVNKASPSLIVTIALTKYQGFELPSNSQSILKLFETAFFAMRPIDHAQVMSKIKTNTFGKDSDIILKLHIDDNNLAPTSSQIEQQSLRIKAFSDETGSNVNHYVTKCGLSSTLNIPDYMSTTTILQSYNQILTGGMKYFFEDGQCKFKAVIAAYNTRYDSTLHGSVTQNIPNWSTLVYSGTTFNYILNVEQLTNTFREGNAFKSGLSFGFLYTLRYPTETKFVFGKAMIFFRDLNTGYMFEMFDTISSSITRSGNWKLLSKGFQKEQNGVEKQDNFFVVSILEVSTGENYVGILPTQSCSSNCNIQWKKIITGATNQFQTVFSFYHVVFDSTTKLPTTSRNYFAVANHISSQGFFTYSEAEMQTKLGGNKKWMVAIKSTYNSAEDFNSALDGTDDATITVSADNNPYIIYQAQQNREFSVACTSGACLTYSNENSFIYQKAVSPHNIALTENEYFLDWTPAKITRFPKNVNMIVPQAQTTQLKLTWLASKTFSLDMTYDENIQTLCNDFDPATTNNMQSQIKYTDSGSTVQTITATNIVYNSASTPKTFRITFTHSPVAITTQQFYQGTLSLHKNYIEAGGLIQTIQIELKYCPALPDLQSTPQTQVIISSASPFEIIVPIEGFAPFATYCPINTYTLLTSADASNHPSFDFDNSLRKISAKSTYPAGQRNVELIGTHNFKLRVMENLDNTVSTSDLPVNLIVIDPCTTLATITWTDPTSAASFYDYTQNTANRYNPLSGQPLLLRLPQKQQSSGWSLTWNNQDCGDISNFVIVSVSGAQSQVPATTLQAVQQALSVIQNADGSYDLRIYTANTEIGGFYLVTFSVGLRDHALPVQATGMTAATGTITVKFEIFDECTQVVLNSIDDLKMYEVTMLEQLNITFSAFTVSGNATRNCGTPNYPFALLVDTHPVVEKVYANWTISDMNVPVLLTNAIKATLVSEYNSFDNFAQTVTFLHLRVIGTLKQQNAAYPERSITIKIKVKQCRVTKILPGNFGSTKLPIKYTLPEEKFLQSSSPEVLKFTFSEYLYEPAECQTDKGRKLEFFFTPFMQDSGIISQVSVDQALKSAIQGSQQTSLQAYETCPSFLKFGVISNQRTFQIQASEGEGTYKVFVMATLYNPYTNSTVIDSSLNFTIEVVPPSTFVAINSPPMFVKDPSEQDITVPVNVRVGDADQTFQDDKFMFSLPKYEDLEGDDVKMTVSLSNLPKNTAELNQMVIEFQTFFQLDDVTSFGEEQDFSVVEMPDILKAVGLQEEYSITVKLEDSQGSTTYKLTVKYLVQQFVYKPLQQSDELKSDNQKGASTTTKNETNTNTSTSKSNSNTFVFQQKLDLNKTQKNETQIVEVYIPPPPKIKLQTIDNFGAIMIVFSEELKISQFSMKHVEENLDNLLEFTILTPKNPDSADIKQESSQLRRLQDTNQTNIPILEQKAISLITLERLDKGAIMFNIQFVNPFAITPAGSTQKDELEIRFINETITLSNGVVTNTIQEYWSSVETKFTIEPSNLVMTFPIPGQIPLEQQAILKATGEAVESSVNSAMLGNLFFQLLMSSSLKKLLKMVSQLQLIVYLCLMNFNFPGNMHFLLVNLQGLADLKLIPSGFLKDLIGDTSKPKNLDPNMEANGYGSSNFLINLGGFLVVGLLFGLSVCILMCVGCLLKRFQESYEMRKTYIKLKHKVFWGMITQVSIHSYTKMAISCFISIKDSNWTSASSLAIFVFYLNGFPLWILYFVNVNYEKIVEILIQRMF